MNLRSGPFNVLYENGFLRHIRYGNNEILRMIYFALRDENWSTIPLEIRNEEIKSASNGFVIQYEGLNTRAGESLLKWDALIEGKSNGEITFTLNGEVLKSHHKNRAGFCVLHPLKETIDQPVEITHEDGTVSKNTFPRFISPQDPFTEIKSMRWEINQVWYTLLFEGDLFETEDQRNWSDASFKTFCTPLRIPFPAELKKGDIISQKIIFKPETQLAYLEQTETIEISVTKIKFIFPRIGIGSSPFEMFTEKIFQQIRVLKLAHYRIDVDLSAIDWEDRLTNDILISQRLELPLELVIHLQDESLNDVNSLIEILKKDNVPLSIITLLSKGELTTRENHYSTFSTLKNAFPETQIGAGTDFNFTELNRHRFPQAGPAFVTFALDPQEHATDDLTIIENLEAQYYGVISARNIYGLPVHVSPVTLKRRYNPYATNPAAFTESEATRTDKRQVTPFGSVWTLGSIKSLSQSEVAAVTYYQCIGSQGIISEEGTPHPVFDALKMIFTTGRNSFLETRSSSPLKVDGIAFEDGSTLLWNYTGENQEVSIHPDRTITLGPYEITVV